MHYNQGYFGARHFFLEIHRPVFLPLLVLLPVPLVWNQNFMMKMKMMEMMIIKTQMELELQRPNASSGPFLRCSTRWRLFYFLVSGKALLIHIEHGTITVFTIFPFSSSVMLAPVTD